MKRFYVAALLATAATLLAADLAWANIVVGAYYPLGEGDAGADDGAAGNATTADTGPLNLHIDLARVVRDGVHFERCIVRRSAYGQYLGNELRWRHGLLH